MASFGKVLSTFFTEYAKTPSKLKIIDVYLIYIMITGAIQFAYMLLVGTFPFNAFLAGFISTLGTFVLTGMILITNAKKKKNLDLNFDQDLPRPTLADSLFSFHDPVSLRMQIDATNKESKNILQERAFADWLFANIVFYLATVGFLG